MEIEHRLLDAEALLDEVSEDLASAEETYEDAKGALELAEAQALVALYKSGEKLSVARADAEVVLMTQQERADLKAALIVLKACKGRAELVRTKVNVAQSLGANMRSAMNL